MFFDHSTYLHYCTDQSLVFLTQYTNSHSLTKHDLQYIAIQNSQFPNEAYLPTCNYLKYFTKQHLGLRGGTPYNGLYGEAPPERGTFFRLSALKQNAIKEKITNEVTRGD